MMSLYIQLLFFSIQMAGTLDYGYLSTLTGLLNISEIVRWINHIL